MDLRWIALALIYALVVRLLRYRRMKALPLRFKMQQRSDFATMTADQAQAILKDLTELEFPKFMGFSIVFALFKTYGIPSISSLLVAIGETTSEETASKRTADTGALILEFALNKPSSPRSMKAIARMNYLHSGYIRAGKISNDDLLYTLSVFALEPARWINNFEWRELTELERCAIGTYWQSLGDAMKISFEALPSHKSGWQDGLHWLEEVQLWSEQYEQEKMLPAKTNNRLANKHLDVIFLNVPSSVKIIGQRVVSVIVGERLREAMMLPKPANAYYTVVPGALTVRQYLLRYCFLPRPEFMRKDYTPEPGVRPDQYHMKEYLSYPWYVKPTWIARWGPRVWMTRLLGRKLPGDDGNRYAPEGFVVTNVGPRTKVGKGTHEMLADEGRLRDMQRGACPFRAMS